LLVSVDSHEDVGVTEASWVRLAEHAMWPVAVFVLVVVLRRQIGDFLSAIGGRITQVSVMSVTIELAVATETVPTWRGVGGDDVRGLVPAQQVNDSYFDTLRQSLQVPGTADYFVVDLKSDGRKEWLTSRLYLFTYLLSRMKGVRAIVFTATRGDVARSFLGVAGSEELLHVLAAAEPWLRLARMQVEADQVGRLPDPVASQPPLPGRFCRSPHRHPGSSRCPRVVAGHAGEPNACGSAVHLAAVPGIRPVGPAGGCPGSAGRLAPASRSTR
jgi:hypothetical protein